MPIKVKVQCDECGTPFRRARSEVNRAKRQSRGLFCTLRCSARHSNRVSPKPNLKNLRADNRRDRDTRFRWFLARVRYRTGPATNRRLGKSHDLTIPYLRKLWRRQDRVCPITGWRLRLPHSTNGWDADTPRHRRASLDRIDSRLGYVRGNVRFVSVMVNNAKNDFTDAELIAFCRAVAKLHPAEDAD